MSDSLRLHGLVYGILHARSLERVIYPSPEDFSNSGIEPRSPTLQADFLLAEPPGKPKNTETLLKCHALGTQKESFSLLTFSYCHISISQEN